MTAGLALLCPERRAKTIDLTKCVDGSLVVQLPGLSQIDRLPKIVYFEQSRRSLTGGWCQDGSGHLHIAIGVQPVADGTHHGGPNPKQRPLLFAADPEMAMLHQELNAVFLGRDGILLRRLHYFKPGHVQFVTARHAGGAWLGLHPASEDD